MNKATLLREKLVNNQIIRLIGAHDGLGAKLGELSGFDGIWASGFEISSSHCVPDANILSMTECLQVADSINRAVNIPVIADCDSGFGDLNNIIHLVTLYESRGIAGVCIEDKHFPKTNSFIDSRQVLVSIEDFSAKLMAAKNAKKHQDFLIIARIEALISGAGMVEALNRAYAYQKAGADAILIHSKLKEPKEIFEFMSMFKGELPVFVVPTTYFTAKISDFIDARVKAVIYANHGIRASVVAMKETFQNIISNDGTLFIEEKIAPLEELFELQGMNLHNKNYKIYSALAKENAKEFLNHSEVSQ